MFTMETWDLQRVEKFQLEYTFIHFTGTNSTLSILSKLMSIPKYVRRDDPVTVEVDEVKEVPQADLVRLVLLGENEEHEVFVPTRGGDKERGQGEGTREGDKGGEDMDSK